MEKDTVDRIGSDPVTRARQFVQQADVPTMKGPADVPAPQTVMENLNAAKNQAAVVGSEAISFVTGVTVERREAIINSSLLAQLVAMTKVPSRDDIRSWYDVYFDVLANIGWVIQEKGFSEYQESGADFDAHKAVMKVAASVLGPVPTALAIVTTTLNALHSIDEKQPWIRVFNRSSKSARAARFQISLAEQQQDGQFFVTLMAFILEAKLETTQVLFFKARKEEAKLRSNSGKVTINTSVLDGVREQIKGKLVGKAQGFVSKLPDLPDLEELPAPPLI